MNSAGDFMKGIVTAGEVQQKVIAEESNKISEKQGSRKELEAQMNAEDNPEKLEQLDKAHKKLGAELIKHMKKKREEESKLRGMISGGESGTSGGDSTSDGGGDSGTSGGGGASQTGGKCGDK